MTFRDRGGEYLAKMLADGEAAARVAEIREQMRHADAEDVSARACLVWTDDVADIWLQSPNAFLAGVRPLDVLLTDGAARVLESLDAEMGGGAA
ncbi:antitoxin Xre/MbcA/ParS toxin-binding domain-containing protein [Mycobacteroides abscessus]|uniref:antitoxin Xre/MbcA/ParS toxin-binding domain-containing protein n=1 Tax=Mycobacteroides abscessus TaxID=36809 RepID=UPI000C25813F|nr:antitoxin Xre/MbcA/ParS toxin-binding domain-containing protein [Mycobacteroides abscessus]AWG62952.1 DUF2384 domain-containing protein [Mycobacteroides abscessus]PVA29553.1 DUF2384 domain-containing protein [Mycobacteroides abscessus]PVA43459.1 DUF2384 domain-containing protein [Mycobacteroides abscessus]PVA73589.1 DUF2384 domain-containing protein [Mycobacteroides abscessus]PVB12072.1 DUF2384 domain-containing protein [Mycobacteroides abscessus]